MWLNNLNFINIPAARFKKPTIRTLASFYAAIYDRFETEENKGTIWQDECYNALISSDFEALKKLEKQRGKVTFFFETLDIFIDKFTRDDCSQDFSFYLDTIKKFPFVQDILIEQNPKKLTFKTQRGDIEIFALSESMPMFWDFFGITKECRHGKCHNDSVLVSKKLPQKNYLATGYNHTFGEGRKYLHSWVETELDDGTYVLDTTRNLLMKKKDYYFIRNVNGPVYKIPNETIKKEHNLFYALYKENPWLFKLYLANRPQALEVYRILSEHYKRNGKVPPFEGAYKYREEIFGK